MRRPIGQENIELARMPPAGGIIPALRPDLARREQAVVELLDNGQYGLVVERALEILRERPDDLHAVESLIRARWRSGDMRGTLLSANLALKLNPHEPGYRYLRGHVFQSVGMLLQAMEEFETCMDLSGDPATRERAAAAARALEDWQVALAGTLLSEDRSFRLRFAIDPAGSLAERGFYLREPAIAALVAMSAGGPRRTEAGTS